jgi:hypothetical protein
MYGEEQIYLIKTCEGEKKEKYFSGKKGVEPKENLTTNSLP